MEISQSKGRWDKAAFDDEVQAGKFFSAYYQLKDNCENIPFLETTEQFIGSVIGAYDAALQARKVEDAYHFALLLHRRGCYNESIPRVIESAVLLARQDRQKTDKKISEGNYYRASDKGVWACVRFAEVMGLQGITPELEKEFRQATLLTLISSARSIGGTDSIERPLIEDYRELGLEPLEPLICAIRQSEIDKRLETALDETQEPEERYYSLCSISSHANVIKDYGYEPALGEGIEAAALACYEQLLGQAKFIEAEAIVSNYFENDEALLERLYEAEYHHNINLIGADRVNDGYSWDSQTFVRYAEACRAIIRSKKFESKELAIAACKLSAQTVPAQENEYEFLLFNVSCNWQSLGVEENVYWQLCTRAEDAITRQQMEGDFLYEIESIVGAVRESTSFGVKHKIVGAYERQRELLLLCKAKVRNILAGALELYSRTVLVRLEKEIDQDLMAINVH